MYSVRKVAIPIKASKCGSFHKEVRWPSRQLCLTVLLLHTAPKKLSVIAMIDDMEKSIYKCLVGQLANQLFDTRVTVNSNSDFAKYMLLYVQSVCTCLSTLRKVLNAFKRYTVTLATFQITL